VVDGGFSFRFIGGGEGGVGVVKVFESLLKESGLEGVLVEALERLGLAVFVEVEVLEVSDDALLLLAPL
jgi:hypothetical protein